MFGFVQDRIHPVYTRPGRSWYGTVPHRITFISGPISCQIADPIRTESSRVNTRLKATSHSTIFDIPMRPVREDQRHRRHFTR